MKNILNKKLLWALPLAFSFDSFLAVVIFWIKFQKIL